MKYLVLADGDRYVLPPLSIEEFLFLNLWVWGSDTAWSRWLAYNKFVDLRDFRNEVLATATIEIEDMPYPTLWFTVDDGETWKTIEEHGAVPRGVQYLRIR